VQPFSRGLLPTPTIAMPAGHGAPQRRHTTSLSIGHAHPLGSLPNMPPAAASGYVPRRLYDDIATGLLHDPARAEITRLSAKTLELTAKLQVCSRSLHLTLNYVLSSR
jgi:hypothetical protein